MRTARFNGHLYRGGVQMGVPLVCVSMGEGVWGGDVCLGCVPGVCVSRGMFRLVWRRGVCPGGGSKRVCPRSIQGVCVQEMSVSGSWGCMEGCVCPGGVYDPEADTPGPSGRPPVNRMTDRCKNISFPQLCLREVIYVSSGCSYISRFFHIPIFHNFIDNFQLPVVEFKTFE